MLYSLPSGASTKVLHASGVSETFHTRVLRILLKPKKRVKRAPDIAHFHWHNRHFRFRISMKRLTTRAPLR